jgi:hypothetical protein
MRSATLRLSYATPSPSVQHFLLHASSIYLIATKVAHMDSWMKSVIEGSSDLQAL